MWDESFHIQNVDRTLETLRAACLGQDTRLRAILPHHLLAQPTEQQSLQISEQILFALVKNTKEFITAEELTRTRQWLNGVAQYLLAECADDDQTFYQLKRLILLPQTTRQTLFRDLPGAGGKDLRENDPPELLKNPDSPFWWLLKVQGLTSSAEAMHSNLRNVLSSS